MTRDRYGSSGMRDRASTGWGSGRQTPSGAGQGERISEKGEGEAPGEPGFSSKLRLGWSLALPNLSHVIDRGGGVIEKGSCEADHRQATEDSQSCARGDVTYV